MIPGHSTDCQVVTKMTRVDPTAVLTEPRRRAILRLIWTDEMSAGDIAARQDVTFGAVSQHLSLLREHGFVTVRQEGRRRLYRADHDGLGPWRTVLESMWAATLDGLAAAIEGESRRGDGGNATSTKESSPAPTRGTRKGRGR